MGTTSIDTPLEDPEIQAYRILTNDPEADGTDAWSSTTMVIVEAHGGGKIGVGYTYGSRAMVRTIRNQGRPGLYSMAIAAVDAALWDLKATLLEVPLVVLLGSLRKGVPVYGSGGSTSHSPERLCEQLAGWVDAGFRRVKMQDNCKIIKMGARREADPDRVRLAADTIGPETDSFVDANGAYSRKQALVLAERFAAFGVS